MPSVRASGRMKALPVAMLAGVVLAGCGRSAKPGNQAVYGRIASMTNCAALQAQFNTASANHDRELHRNLDLAEIDTSYMEAADARMEDLGCGGGR